MEELPTRKGLLLHLSLGTGREWRQKNAAALRV